MEGKKISVLPPYREEVRNVISAYDSSKNGLENNECTKRLLKYGPNELKKINKIPWPIKFLHQLKDLMIILLLICSFISFYLKDGRTGTILLIIVAINACIGFFQEFKAEKIMDSLESLLVAKAKVIRNDKLSEIASSQLVPGDIIRVDEGESIPADARLIDEKELSTNDFALTGESNPSRKFIHAIKGEVPLANRHNLIYMGTTVATGNATAIVVGTGMQTELGRIASLSQETRADLSPLQKEMNHLAKTITKGTLIVGTILTIIALKADLSIKEAFLFALGVASAMIPQGLPAEVNVSLAQAANKLARARALVKKLSAVETLGATSIILTDKTGTLTKNQITVEQLLIGDDEYFVTGSGYAANGKILNSNKKPLHENELEQLKIFFVTGAFASNASVNPPDKDHSTWYCMGDPTEGALLTLAHKAGLDTNSLDSHHKEIREFPFDSARKRMSSIRQYNNQLTVFSKGAPENLLSVCTHIWVKGRIRKLTSSDKEKINQRNELLAKNALRNLAYAYKTLPANSSAKRITMDQTESNLIFLGMASMIDPPREEVKEAMIAARDANIPVSIITGDNALTAKAIALKVKLATRAEEIFMVGGDELKLMEDQDLAKLLSERNVIFSRVAPEDKLRIVELSKKQGHVVAVTGDGINDAPALKRADIGVAMGQTGTDVAKQSAEIVLLDDSFHTLVGAIQQGRIIFQNIKKATLSCLTSNTGELFTVLISLAGISLFGIPLAITAVQILAIDLIAELFPISALGWDPAESELMKDKPRRLRDHILDLPNIADLLTSGLLIGILAYSNYLFFFFRNGISTDSINSSSPIYARATILTYLTIVLCQFINILLRRVKSHRTIFTSYLWSNKRLLGAFGFSIFCVLLIIYVPVFQNLFGAGPLELVDWITALVCALIYLFIRESAHMIKRSTKTV